MRYCRKDAYTTGELAELLGISIRAVIRLCDSGDLKHFRLPPIEIDGKPGPRRILRASVEKLLEADGFEYARRDLKALDMR